MRSVLSLAAVAFALSVSAPLPADAQKLAQPVEQDYKAKSPKLNKADIDALLAKPDQLVIVDVRRPDELTEKGGFPAFLSIQAKDLENRLAFIPKDRTIITVSNHAHRAGAAADYLADHGFKVAGAAGAQDYESQGGTIVKIAPPAPQPSAQTGAQDYKYKAAKLNKAQIDALLAKPEELLIVDVRRPDEITASGGFSVFLSIQAKELESRLAFIPKDRTIITVSNHFIRAGAAADYLAEHGYKVAGAASVLDYQSEGGAVVKIAPAAQTASRP